MQLTEFLARVLPASGGDYIGISNQVGTYQFKHVKIESLQQFSRFAAQADKQQCNAYFATGVFDGKRDGNHAGDKKAFFVDIDCGPTKEYASKKEAVLAVHNWCKTTGFLPPTIMVDSGNGIHAYWTLAEPVDKPTWQSLAENLKARVKEGGLYADEVVTADPARIMRLPSTMNWKDQSAPKQVRIVHELPHDYSVEQFRTMLGAFTGSEAAKQLSEWADDEDLTDNVGFAELDDRPRYAGRMIKRCPVLAHSYNTGGQGQAEPLWMQQLHLLAYCEDGEDFIHAVSDKHNDYDYQRTLKKFKQRVEKKDEIGPTLCKTLGRYYPEKCAGCPHNGAIKTPLQLGSEEANELPFGYMFTEKGGVARVVKARDRDTGLEYNEYTPVFPERIENFMVFRPSDAGMGASEFTIRFDIPDSERTPPVAFELSALRDGAALSRPLSQCGIVLTPNEQKEFVILMAAWVRKMKQSRQINERVERMGWHEDRDHGVGFALATDIHWHDGSSTPVAFGDLNLMRQYMPVGDAQLSKKLLHDLTTQGRPEANAIIASAFASPLVKFTGVAGVLFAITSEKSGTGKSTAMKIAQSVWGCPTRGVNALNDTPLSVAHKLGHINNLPAYWDELRMKEDVRSFIKLVFQLGQGKERSRLTSRVEAQNTGTWQTLMTVASNESVYDHVSMMVSNTNAGVLRVFEAEMRSVPAFDMGINTRISQLDRSYGWVGAEYAKWLAGNHATVEKLVSDTLEKFNKALKATSDERFWIAALSVLYVGAALSVKLGHTSIDLKGLKLWLLKCFRAMRARYGDTYQDANERAASLLMEFFEKHREQISVIDNLPVQGRGKTVGVVHNVQPLRGEVVGCIAIRDGSVRVALGAFRQWLYAHKGETPTHVVRELEAQGAQKVKGRVAFGVGHTTGYRMQVLDVPLDQGHFTDIVEAMELEDDLGA